MRNIHRKGARAAEMFSYRTYVKKKVLQPLDDIGLWSYQEIKTKKSVRYTIEAGPVLIAFSKLVYVPIARRQNHFFGDL